MLTCARCQPLTAAVCHLPLPVASDVSRPRNGASLRAVWRKRRPREVVILLRAFTTSLGPPSFDHDRCSVGQPPGQLHGFSGVSFGAWSGVVLGSGLESQQLRELASGVSSVVTGGLQEAEGFHVLAAGALTHEGASDDIACADPSGHGAAGSYVPSAGVETFD
jgi:hypothetical protein